MNETPKLSEKQQARNAFGFGAILTIIVTIILIVSFFEDRRNNSNFFSFSNGLTGIALVSSLLLMGLSRIGRHIWGVIQFCVVIIAVSIGVTINFAGFGLVLGIASLLAILILITTSLPSKFKGWMMIWGLLGGLAVIFLDFYYPGSRSTPNLAWSVPYLIGILIIAYAVLLGRQYRNYSLRLKFIFSIVSITLLSVATIAISTNYFTKNALTDQIGQVFYDLVEAQASRVGVFIESKVRNIEAFALSGSLVEEVKAANLSYKDKTNEEIRAEIAEKDKAWIAADAVNDTRAPLLQDRLNNPVAKAMQEYSKAFPDNVEVFVTDRYGALVGAYTYASPDSNTLGRPSDYDQSDEGWWQATYNDGAGKVFIGVPELAYISRSIRDENIQTITLIIGMPIRDLNTGETLGVFRATLSLKAIEDFLRKRVGETGEIDLIFPGEPPQLLHSGIIEPMDPRLYDELQKHKLDSFSIVYEDVPSLVSQAKISGNSDYINDLSWILVLHQPEKEALASVSEQTRAVTIIAFVIALVVAGVAGGLAQILASPVSRLTAVAEKVALGDLNAKAQVESDDEIGRLAGTFNLMTSELKSTLSGLEQRIVERTQAIETAAIVGRRISTILDVRQLAVETVQQLQQAFHYYHVHIYLYDNEKENLIMTGGTGEVSQIMLSQKHKIPRGRGLVGRASDTGSVILVSDTTKNPDWLPNPLLPETKSEIAVPIVIGDEVLGALDVQQNIVDGLTQQDVDLLQLVSSQIAVAIRNARLYESVEKRAEDERRISAIIDQIQSTSTIEDALQVATREVGRALNAPFTLVKINSNKAKE